MSLAELNFLAVGTATVLTFVLGGLWYSPLLFGKPWMAGHGYTETELREKQAGMGPTYAISFVCWLVMATVLALVAPHFGDGVLPTLHMGLLLWLGFAATVGLTNNLIFGQSAQPVGHRCRVSGGLDRDHGGGSRALDVGCPESSRPREGAPQDATAALGA